MCFSLGVCRGVCLIDDTPLSDSTGMEGSTKVFNAIFRSMPFVSSIFSEMANMGYWPYVYIDHNVFIILLFQYRSLAPLYYRDASAAIVVYDITSQVSTKYQ